MKRRGARILGGLALAAVGVFALLLAGGQHLQLAEGRDILASGARVSAQVTGKEAARKGPCYFSYAYAAGGRQHEKRRVSVSCEDQRALEPGKPVEAWHDRERPEKSVTRAELAELESIPNRMLFPLIALFCLFAGGVYVFRKPKA